MYFYHSLKSDQTTAILSHTAVPKAQLYLNGEQSPCGKSKKLLNARSAIESSVSWPKTIRCETL